MNRHWWEGYLAVLYDPRSAFRSPGMERHGAGLPVAPAFIFAGMVFFCQIGLISDLQLVREIISADEKWYTTVEEKEGAELRRDSVERAMENYGVRVILSVRMTCITCCSLVVSMTIICLALCGLSGRWSSIGGCGSVIVLSTGILTLGVLINTLMRMAVGRVNGTLSPAFLFRPFDARTPLHFFASQCDLFVLSYLAMVAYGFTCVGQMPMRHSLLTSYSVWSLLVLISYHLQLPFIIMP